MLYQFLFFIIHCVLSSVSINPGPQNPPTKGEVWPLPQQQIKYDTYYKLSLPEFEFQNIGESCEILKTAMLRYTDILRTMHRIVRKPTEELVISDNNFQGIIQELQINLTSPCEEYPHMDMDETYSLNVSEVATLTSSSIWGALRGMETFAQLFYLADDYTEIYINSTEIVDHPSYPYRGLMIDTARHFISVQNILKNLDAMEMNKLNVLHWHIVDDQSFPYESKKFPELSTMGAYDQTMVYTRDDIDAIIAYAKDRGIRVLPEFDVPGHTRSWGEAYPNILTKCYQSGHEVGLGPMDPTNNATYKLLRNLIEEVQEVFPDEYFHLGGDEVQLKCWNSNPQIQKFMKKHKLKRVSNLHAYFMTQVIPLLGQKSKPIVWQDVFDNGVALPKDTIVQTWRVEGGSDMERILKAGHKTIYSASWYLDQLKNGGDWTKYYNADPRQMIKKKHLDLTKVLGGAACMWGEVVDDTNIISRIWPRTSAMAEKLWSAPSSSKHGKIPDSVYYRLEEHTCRMNRRGIRAQPPTGSGYCIGGY